MRHTERSEINEIISLPEHQHERNKPGAIQLEVNTHDICRLSMNSAIVSPDDMANVLFLLGLDQRRCSLSVVVDEHLEQSTPFIPISLQKNLIGLLAEIGVHFA